MVTILYCTSNREDWGFEQKVIAELVKNCGDLPIVSVSQKVMDLGKNICVGNFGKSYYAEFMQIKKGLEAIDTPYVLVAESDTIYPPEYFKFKPDGGKCYRFDNVWVHYNYTKPMYHFKRVSHCAQMVDRKAWLDAITNILNLGYHDKITGLQLKMTGSWTAKRPVVTFKTGMGMRKFTYTRKIEPKTTLPYWGSADKLRQRFLCLDA